MTFGIAFLDLDMIKKTIYVITFSISFLAAGMRVSVNDLTYKDKMWFYKESSSPFTGVAVAISEETGTIVQQVNYIDGLAWGKYYEWWPSGERKVDGTYRFGLMYGRWKFFYENGKIQSAGSYMNGKGHSSVNMIESIPNESISGLWTFWNSEGRKVEEGYYSKTGIEKGNWAFWDRDGKKRMGKKIDYNTFQNSESYKHLNGKFLVTGPINGTSTVYTQAHGVIRNGKLDGSWTFWDNNGYLAAKKEFDNGIQKGHSTTYHPKGHKLTDGLVSGFDDYGNLIKDGKWLFWNESGIIKEEVNFNNGKRQGLTTYFSSTGKESAKIIYKDDLPWDGEWTTWYQNGSKKETGIYAQGQKQSPWTAWYENGQKKYVIHYVNSIKHGLYTEWTKDGRLHKDINFDNGIPITEYLVDYQGDGYTEINRRNGELSGSWIKWYANGKKSEEGVYKYGKKGGIWSSWFPNGEKKYNAKFIDGKPDGNYSEYDNKGRITKKIEYKEGSILSEHHIIRDASGITEYHKSNGVLDGKWTRWYPNGNKAEQGTYMNGKKNGSWNGWFKTNKKNYNSNYDNGKRAGNYIEWDTKGKKVKDIEYSNGNRIKEYLIIKDGVGFMEVSKRYGKLNGPWVRWYSQGIKEEEGKYKNGIKVGTWSKYSMDGTVIEEWNYDNEGRNLYEITYYDNGTVKQYRDFFSKTVQEYNIDGSLRGERTPFN